MKRKLTILLLYLPLILTCSCNIDHKHSGQSSHIFNGPYTGENLNHTAFPLGGIGAGMVCLEGTGCISHVSVRNQPDLDNEPLTFAAISVKGDENIARVIEGPVPDWKIFCKPESGNGLGGTTYGLPRFESASFTARFPFSTVSLEDQDIPLETSITGWSPFIPGDEDNSSLPVAALEYTFSNNTNKNVEAVFSFNTVNFMRVYLPSEWGSYAPGDRIREIDNGFILHQEGSKEYPYVTGDFAVFTTAGEVIVDHCWFRGGWWDPLTITWKNIEEMELRSTPPQDGSAPGASLSVPFQLAPGEEKTIPLLFAWYIPESNLQRGTMVESAEKYCEDPDCCPTTYIPWYASRFESINDIAKYWLSRYKELKEQSALFREAFYAMDLPDEVVEAVAANLTILKSPTVLRQHDGKLWCWEGCHDNLGCCHGSCTHVWNYAQAIPHLFPRLERSLRHTEFLISQDEAGHQTFRSNLPISPTLHNFYAAVDGQLGGIMKIFREWRISGDQRWLEVLWPSVKSSMNYCIHTWDPGHKGVVEEPHHNTYDIEFWGPDGMCMCFYLGALNAIISMGKNLGEDVTLYQELFDKGKKFLEDSLFNGEYFYQIVKTTGLKAPDPVEASRKSMGGDYSPEALEVLENEGPKYQYGNGCISDGVLGIWLARTCGLEDFIDPEKVISHLYSVYHYNMRYDLSDHVNPQRPSFAMGPDGGLLLCTWPHGDQPSLPFVYSNEVWTGIEYQVASHLMMMGMVEEGLDIVRTCRKRYDGRIRNPFDEYECGHWYARAMSSYGLLQGLTGVRYDAVDNILYIDSKIGDQFTSFLSTETGFGNVGLIAGEPFLEIKYGEIQVKEIVVKNKEE
ncbi:MAG: hypothetical protein AMS27_05030 [Bacteroides sp. SM23_62_1]|nr:MAG: hypothetical protein AMS27_05030 [Bacteroides sp. SM23_62_1]